MELKRDLIIKALECCNSTENCNGCPYYKGDEVQHCEKDKDALSLIKELTVKVESLKQCMEHEHASFMETFGELDDKCKRLTEENERLRAENDELCDNIACLEIDKENAERRTVRKMQTEIEARCLKGGIYPAFVKSTIDQIAKEMMEDENATN